MSTWTPEFGFERFQQVQDVIRGAQGSNEATTRLRAIDTVLFDVLGWDRLNVDAELYCRTQGYADYAFRDGSICLILEAKNSGETFLLPDRTYPCVPIGFPLLAEECPEAEQAMRQALGYAALVGSRYIAITNGHQWLLTLTFVATQQVTERSVFVFESVDAIRDRFRTFWDCFSPHALTTNRPANALLESRKAPAPTKLSQRITNYPAPASRNEIVNELGTVISAVWDEVRNAEDEEEFLRECYVKSAPTVQSISQATELLDKRLSIDAQIQTQIIDPRDVPEHVQDYAPDKPIVVLGRVGHGKTTFLRYLRKIKAKPMLKKYIQLELNFLDRPDSAAQVGQYVYAQIETQLREHYNLTISDDSFVRGVLHSELSRFRRSPEGKMYEPDSPEFKKEEIGVIKSIRDDPHRFLQLVFHHARAGRQYSIAVFFDNLDRRNTDIQEAAFLTASAIARDWAALVFVCLRPGTFYYSRSFGVLDSVAPRLISIASPMTQPLVCRRLKYAQRYAEGTSVPGTRLRGLPTREFSFNLPTVSTFLECCAESFRANKKLCRLFDAVSNGNARDLLTYVYKVLTSYHLNTGKILTKYKAGGYIMPVHEALRCLLFGDSLHYDPDRSLFINLFDIQKADPVEHFTRLATLHYLATVPDAHPRYGYAPVAEIVRYLCQLGYSEEHVNETLQYLLKRRCCEASIPVDEWNPDVRNLRLTSLGRYHIGELVYTFTYMDAVTIDTPILKDAVRQDVQDVLDIEARLQRCERFVTYLDECSANIQDGRVPQSWQSAVNGRKWDMKHIQQSWKGTSRRRTPRVRRPRRSRQRP